MRLPQALYEAEQSRRHEVSTFASTIEAIGRSGRPSAGFSGVFFNLNSNTNGALEAIARGLRAQEVAQHRTRIALHPDLFTRMADRIADALARPDERAET